MVVLKNTCLHQGGYSFFNWIFLFLLSSRTSTSFTLLSFFFFMGAGGQCFDGTTYSLNRWISTKWFSLPWISLYIPQRLKASVMTSWRSVVNSSHARPNHLVNNIRRSHAGTSPFFRWSRRCSELSKSSLWNVTIRRLMKQFVSESGKDPTGSFKASNMWLSKFTHRYGISKQKKTNKKSKSIEERLLAVRNFHWWAIYQMALEKS